MAKRGNGKREPGRLTVNEMIALLFALAFLISVIYGSGLMLPG